MKNLFFTLMLFLFAACSQNSSNTVSSFGDFIKPNYLNLVSTMHCRLKPLNSLNSLEKFIPIFVKNFAASNIDDSEVYFYFPLSIDEKTNTSEFKLVLQHSTEASLDNMTQRLDGLEFSQIADCIQDQPSQNLARLKKDNFPQTETLLETMTCEYHENYNFATLNLVFEQLIDALSDVAMALEFQYLGAEFSDRTFQWITIFSSAEDRKSFLIHWRSLQVSNEMQALLTEQASCSASEVFRAYKVI